MKRLDCESLKVVCYMTKTSNIGTTPCITNVPGVLQLPALSVIAKFSICTKRTSSSHQRYLEIFLLLRVIRPLDSQSCILWQFRNLPVEVRRVIWWYFDTFSPRFVNLASHLDIRAPKKTIRLLQICRETRQLAQELYRRPLPNSPVLIRLDQAILNLRALDIRLRSVQPQKRIAL